MYTLSKEVFEQNYSISKAIFSTEILVLLVAQPKGMVAHLQLRPRLVLDSLNTWTASFFIILAPTLLKGSRDIKGN